MDSTLLQSLPTLIWAIFFGTTALSLALGALLTYHWFTYAQNRAVSLIALTLYGSVLCALLIALLASSSALIASL